jgi:hypothetical protein
MRSETIEFDDRFGKEYVGKYVFQEITWAKRSRIIQKHTRYHPATGQVVSSDFVAIQAETVWASLKEQPAHKPITFEKLVGEEDGIPIELGEAFSRIVNKLCGIAVDEQRFLSAQSDEPSLIQRSQDSACAKNSGGLPTSSQCSQLEPLRNSS